MVQAEEQACRAGQPCMWHLKHLKHLAGKLRRSPLGKQMVCLPAGNAPCARGPAAGVSQCKHQQSTPSAGPRSRGAGHVEPCSAGIQQTVA